MPERTLCVDLRIDATNDDIIDQMRIMKRGREEGLYENVVCFVRGFDADPRELFEIPEVRAFCRRIVNLGFTSYLDFTTALHDRVPEAARRGWGAAEVWLGGEGRLRLSNLLTRELLEELKRAIGEANARADDALGPMRCA